MRSPTAGEWQTILGVIGTVTAILLAQTEVPLDPIVKLSLVVTAGVVAFLRPKGSNAG